MKFPITLFLVLLCTSVSGSAQHRWELLGPKPLGNDINDVSFVDPEFGVAVGEGGLVLRTTNGGETWNAHTIKPTVELDAVCMTDRSRGWSVSLGGSLLKTSDGGQEWEWQNIPFGFVATDVVFADNDHGWLVGKGADFLRTTDGGTTWLKSETGASWRMLSVCALDTNRLWASGDSATIMKSTDGGVTWIEKHRRWRENGTFRNHHLSTVFALDDDHIWAGGGEIELFAVMYRSTDGGESWEMTFKDNAFEYSVDFQDILFTTADSGWVTGARFNIKSTTDGGESWTKLYDDTKGHPHSGYYPFAGGIALAGDTPWIVGDNGRMFSIARDPDLADTATLRQRMVSAVDSSVALDAVYFLDSLSGVVIGNDPTGTGLLYTTTDGGLNWNEMPIDDRAQTFNGLAVRDNGELWISGRPGTFLVGTWEGTTSIRIETDLDVQFGPIAFTPDGTGWAAGFDPADPARALLASAEETNDWDSVVALPSRCMDMEFPDDDNGRFLCEGGWFVRTNDGGTTWALTQIQGATGEPVSLRAIAFRDAMIGVAVGDDGALFRTTDGGTDWLELDHGLAEDVDFLDIVIGSGSTGWIVGTEGAMYYTEDGGSTWNHPDTSYTDHDLQAIYFSDDRHGWIVGKGGAILRSVPSDPTLSTPVVVGEAAEHIRSAVYPNPAEEDLTLSWSQSDRAGVSVRLSDYLGRTLRSVLVSETMEPGEHAVMIALDGLNGGAYVLSLTVGGRTTLHRVLYRP